MASKGDLHPIMGIVIGAVFLFIGIFIVTQVLNSINLPVTDVQVQGESITFTDNVTCYAVAVPGACITDKPDRTSDCGIRSIDDAYNATAHYEVGNWTI